MATRLARPFDPGAAAGQIALWRRREGAGRRPLQVGPGAPAPVLDGSESAAPGLRGPGPTATMTGGRQGPAGPGEEDPPQTPQKADLSGSW